MSVPATLVEVMSNFRPINRDTGFLLPPSVDEWLPQRHLARFVVEVIDGLDLSDLVKAAGSCAWRPSPKRRRRSRHGSKSALSAIKPSIKANSPLALSTKRTP